MTEERARSLASFLRSTVPGCVAIATLEVSYFPTSMIPITKMGLRRRWIVVANGTVIRDPEELAP